MFCAELVKFTYAVGVWGESSTILTMALWYLEEQLNTALILCSERNWGGGMFVFSDNFVGFLMGKIIPVSHDVTYLILLP
jgi:hypothetical protein